MRAILREADDGVASTVATVFAILVVLIFLSIVVLGTVPSQEYNAEWLTSKHDLSQFEKLRAAAAGPLVAGSSFSVPFALGTAAVSPFATNSIGSLSYSTNDSTALSLSFSFMPSFSQASVRKINQDVVLLMDNSGSMAYNDPQNLRITGAQEYVSHLSPPDCVAIVAFNSQSYLTLSNVGGPVHHLSTPAMCGAPDYSVPRSDLGTITDFDGTNIGLSIQTGNNELIANGHPGKAWIEILLTDGQNECGGVPPPCGNAYTISMAQAAKAHNITIYTIGLSGSADANLLSQIASITGGTYYPAPTASSIRWIYYEISMRYTSSVQCGSYSVTEAYGGSLTLSLSTSQYPSQTMRFEAGGIALSQTTGAAMYEGFPMQYSMMGGGGSLTFPVLTIIGTPFTYTGTATRVVEAQVLARTVVDQAIVRVGLGTEASNVASIVSNVTYWTDQGAAKPSAMAAVNAPLNMSRNELLYANANASLGDYVDAKFSVDRAVSDLSAAIQAAAAQQAAGAMQAWLSRQTQDAIRVEECRLSQWGNWYNGVTIRLTSKTANAWAQWFSQTFSAANAPFSIGYSGDIAVLTLHSLDQVITDERVLSLSSL